MHASRRIRKRHGTVVTVLFGGAEAMAYPKKHRGRRKIGSKRRRTRRKRRHA